MKISPTTWTPLLLLAGGYVLLTSAVYRFQDSFLYFPFKTTLRQTLDRAHEAGLVAWPKENATYRGWVPADPLPNMRHRGTIVIVHGNAGSAIDRQPYAQALEPLGFTVFLYEYPGYGARRGKPGANAFSEDLRETVRQLRGSTHEPVYLWGESLGCGVVAQAAADPSLGVKGVALLAPWTDLPSVAQRRFPFLPARWLVRDRYDTVANLQSFHGPVAVIRLGRDEVIPTEFQQAVFESRPEPKKLIWFPEATHNGWPNSPALPWWREVTDFLTANSLAPE